MQFVPGTPLAGGAGCSTADDTFCFGQSVLAVRPAKACRLGSCILPAGLADGRTGRNVLEGSASLQGRVFFAGIAGVFAAAALGGLADACPRMGCPGAGVVVVCGGGKRGVSAGLSRQMHWAGLFAQAAPQSTAFTVPVYAEYFAVPLLCGREERRGVCLPILTALVQTAATLGMALVFGRTYPARELLRAWSTGTFSRLDAALLLVWLTCAIFRIGVLCTAVRMLGQEYAIQKRKEVRQ